MKKLAIVLMLVYLPSAYGFPRLLQRQQQQKLQQKLRPADRPLPRRALVEDAVLGFYVTEFQKQAEVNPEVFAKILPFLQQFVADRFEVSQRRQRALNQLKQTIQRGGSDDEFRRAIREVDSADADFQANQEKFLSNVDPLLNVRQQAKLRIFQVMADNRMRQILNSLQNPNANQNRQNLAPPPPPQD
jgi:hypothetical protein